MDLHRRLGGVQVFTYTERPDLSERTGEAESTFPEFIHHGEVTTRYWPRLREELPELQLLLYDEERDAVVGRGQTVPPRRAPACRAAWTTCSSGASAAQPPRSPMSSARWSRSSTAGARAKG
jgi:hypothetical protein